MSPTIYKSPFGVVEYDPETKNVNNKNVTTFTVRCAGEVDVRVTVWPELKLPEGILKKGLLVGVRGSYTANEHNGKTYHNVSAFSVAIGDKVYEKDGTPGVAKKPNTAASAEPAF